MLTSLLVIHSMEKAIRRLRDGAPKSVTRRFLPSRCFSSPEPKLTGELIVVGRPLSSVVMYVCVCVSTGAFEDR